MIPQHTIDMTRTWIFTCKNDASDTNSLTDSLAKDGAPCTNLVFAVLVVSFLLIKLLPFQKKKKMKNEVSDTMQYDALPIFKYLGNIAPYTKYQSVFEGTMGKAESNRDLE